MATIAKSKTYGNIKVDLCLLQSRYLHLPRANNFLRKVESVSPNSSNLKRIEWRLFRLQKIHIRIGRSILSQKINQFCQKYVQIAFLPLLIIDPPTYYFSPELQFYFGKLAIGKFFLTFWSNNLYKLEIFTLYSIIRQILNMS